MIAEHSHRFRYAPPGETAAHKYHLLVLAQDQTSVLRLGVPRAVFYDKLDPEIEAAMSAALRLLRGLTAGFREVSLPLISESIAPNIVLAENYAFHAPYFAKAPHLYDGAIRRNLQQGSQVSAAAYIHSRRELEEARRAIGAVFTDVDLL